MHHLGAELHPEIGGRRGVGGDVFPRDQDAAGGAAEADRALGIGAQRQRLGQLGPGDDGAAALSPNSPLHQQFSQRLSHGFAGDAEAGGEVAFRGNRIALVEIGQDQVDFGADEEHLRNAGRLRRIHASSVPGLVYTKN